MKKLLTVLAMAIALTACSSSGISQAEYDKVVAENEELKSKVSELESSSSESYDEAKALVDAYTLEADADMAWCERTIDDLSKLLDGAFDNVVINLINSESQIITDVATYKMALQRATLSADIEEIERLHGEWTAYMKKAHDSAFSPIYETLNPVLVAASKLNG